MLLTTFLISFVLSATGVTISEPEDWTAYNLDELPGIRAIVENENVIPDSVHYSLNGDAVVPIPKLNTDWPTYMQSYLHHGYSESPAPTDNTILWTAPVTGDTHEFPTPVVVEGIVYYPSNKGTDSLYALDAATGELIWKYHVGQTDDAVTVYDGYVYTASDSIFCLDAITGEKMWASGEADDGGSTPVVLDDRVYCGTRYTSSPEDTSVVVCLDALTGAVIWESYLMDCFTASCMTVWNDLVIVPTYLDFSSGTTPSLYALNKETGATVWENSSSEGGYWDSSPVIVDSILYIVDLESARAFNALNGEEVWASTFALGSEATPAYHDGRLYYGGTAYYCCDTSYGELIWSVTGNEHGSPAIADGMVFYGQINYPDPSGIRALDCQTGTEIWHYYADSTNMVQGSPSVVDGIVYMAMLDWNLYAFGTGLKYTYLDETLNPEAGWNELIATSFDNGVAVASDTVNFYINPTGIEFEPSRRLLLTGSPNPFSSSTELSFSLSESGFTSVEIYDLTGRCISNLIESDFPEGNHTVNWGGTDQNGNVVPAGLYMCRIQSGGIIETTGLCLLR